MSGLLGNPKALIVSMIVAALLALGLAGGALGTAFGGGFIGSPAGHIQLPAEPIMATPQLDNLPLIGSFTITNTMVTTWAAILLLIGLSYLGTRKLNDVPNRFQSLLEMVLEFFLNLAESIAGRDNARRFFPLVMTIFLFIVTANWMGVLPGFGTIGRFEPAEEVIHHAEESAESAGQHADLSTVNLQIFDGSENLAYLGFGSIEDVVTAEKLEADGITEGKQAGLLVPFFRSANTDINTTLAIALVAMFTVHWWGLRTLGPLGHIGKFLNFRGGPAGLFVGVIEAISEAARIVSFTFRLFGNIFAGEVLLIAMGFLIPLVGLVPFLGLEIFVGIIQAFIFAILTLVFATAATEAHEGNGH